jgi:hypothetical protein
MRFKNLKLGKTKEEPEEEIIEVEKTTAGQLTEMHEQMSSKTRNLEKTTQQLQELSGTLNGSDEEEERPKPHGPLKELSVEPEDKMMDIDMDTPADEELFDSSGEEIQVVEVSAETPPAETAEQTGPAGENPPESEATEDKEDSEDDSFNSLFNSEEEEINPLASLISALPDVSAQELVDELQEIKDIILDNKRTR